MLPYSVRSRDRARRARDGACRARSGSRDCPAPVLRRQKAVPALAPGRRGRALPVPHHGAPRSAAAPWRAPLRSNVPRMRGRPARRAASLRPRGAQTRRGLPARESWRADPLTYSAAERTTLHATRAQDCNVARIPSRREDLLSPHLPFVPGFAPGIFYPFGLLRGFWSHIAATERRYIGCERAGSDRG